MPTNKCYWMLTPSSKWPLTPPWCPLLKPPPFLRAISTFNFSTLDDVLFSGNASYQCVLQHCDIVCCLWWVRSRASGDTEGTITTPGVNDIHLKRRKCLFLVPEEEYQGHRISRQGLHTTDKKIWMITDTPQPQNVTQLNAFLEMVNHCDNLIHPEPLHFSISYSNNNIVMRPRASQAICYSQDSADWYLRVFCHVTRASMN